VTYRFTDRFDLQVGGRISHINQVFEPFSKFGALNNPNPLFTPETEAHATPFTYLVTPRFNLTPETMVYARCRIRATGRAAATPLLGRRHSTAPQDRDL